MGKSIRRTELLRLIYSDPKLCRPRLIMRENGISLVVEHEGVSYEQALPRGLFQDDLPTWFTSLFEAKRIRLYEELRERWERHFHKALRLSKAVGFAVALCERQSFDPREIFHVKWNNLSLQGIRVSLAGPVNEMRFSPAPLQQWRFTVWCEYAQDAELLSGVIEARTLRHLFVKDRGIEAILACNAERWEAVGLPYSVILKLAKAQGIALHCTARKPGRRYSFLVRN